MSYTNNAKINDAIGSLLHGAQIETSDGKTAIIPSAEHHGESGDADVLEHLGTLTHPHDGTTREVFCTGNGSLEFEVTVTIRHQNN